MKSVQRPTTSYRTTTILRRVIAFSTSFTILTLASGCSPLSALNSSVGSSTYHKSTTHAYGPYSRQQLDVYIPKQRAKNADVVIFFYGGRWRTGEKAEYRFVAEGLAAQGFITVVPDYRLYPQVDWPDFIADGTSVYKWVETHIASYGGNPQRIFLMGHSAGAHIAAMVTLDQSARQRVGSLIPPCGMIGLAGPYDFLPISDADVRQVFQSAKRALETQPIFYADRTDPALLLLTGSADKVVKPRNTQALAAAVRKQGGNAVAVSYPGVGHAGILISLARSLKAVAPTLQDTTNFIRKTTCVH